jgi:polyphosphate kinase
VQVFVELKARFDEANNIKWVKKWKAGVRIFTAYPRSGTFKIALVMKKSTDGIKGYGYVGTGNFNETTAKFYTDHALFTIRPNVIKDLRHLFSILEKRKRPEKNAVSAFRELLVSQYNMVPVFEEEIMTQIKRKKKGLDALIRIKINNLEDVHDRPAIQGQQGRSKDRNAGRKHLLYRTRPKRSE